MTNNTVILGNNVSNIDKGNIIECMYSEDGEDKLTLKHEQVEVSTVEHVIESDHKYECIIAKTVVKTLSGRSGEVKDIQYTEGWTMGIVRD